MTSEATPPNDDSQLYVGSVSRLADLFHGEAAELGHFVRVRSDELPRDAQSLLAHTNHMTVTLEAFHSSLVDVDVLDQWEDEASFAREILLRRQTDREAVQFGIMRIWLSDLPVDAVDAIRRQRQPLGRVLIRQNVLRDVELMALWQIEPAEFLQQHLRLSEGATLYGRTAQILVDERPTVQLLEIVKV